jgi:hypothetical protein
MHPVHAMKSILGERRLTKPEAWDMAISIEREDALRVLKDAVNASRSEELAEDHPWIQRVTNLWEACKATNKTMIPILGTAILARATNLKVDPFALQAQAGDNAFDARGLCTHVLAANARDLGIDLGVRSREPHNSNPFTFEPKVSSSMKAKSPKALELLIDALTALSKTRSRNEAAVALQAFVQVRVLKRSKIQIGEQEGDHLDEQDLIELIKAFVKQDSEKGSRAQVVVAGLLDTLHGTDLVVVGNPHDPSSKVAGDVRVYRKPNKKELAFAYEVRFKSVSITDLKLIVDGFERKKVPNFGVIAVASNQKRFDPKQEVRHAEKIGTRLGIFFGWEEFVRGCLFFSILSGPAVGHAYRAIFARMNEQEISDEGIEFWRQGKPS